MMFSKLGLATEISGALLRAFSELLNLASSPNLRMRTKTEASAPDFCLRASPGTLLLYDLLQRQLHRIRSILTFLTGINDISNGNRQCLTVVDEFTRQGMTVEVARNMTGADVVTVLERLFAEHGKPVCIRSDNGTELVSSAVQKWLGKKHVDTHYIDPGSPWQNAYCESFNSIFRTTCLDRSLFMSLTEARVVIKDWLREYNEVRPHGSLKGDTPALFLRNWAHQEQIHQPGTLTM